MKTKYAVLLLLLGTISSHSLSQTSAGSLQQRGIFSKLMEEEKEAAQAEQEKKDAIQRKKVQLAEAEKEHEQLIKEMEAEEKAKEEAAAEEALKQEDENRYLAAQKRKEDMMKEIDNSAAQVKSQRGDAVMLAQTAPATNKTALAAKRGISKYLKASLNKEPRLEIDFIHPEDKTVEPNSPMAIIGSAPRVAPPAFVQLEDDAGAAATTTTPAATDAASTAAASDAAVATTTAAPASGDAAAATTAAPASGDAAAASTAAPASGDAAANSTAPAASDAAASSTVAPATAPVANVTAPANASAPATIAPATTPVPTAVPINATTNVTAPVNATAPIASPASVHIDEKKAIQELKEQDEAEHDLKAKPEDNSPRYMMPYFNASRPEGAKKHPTEADAKPFFARPPKDRTHYEKPEGLTWKDRYP